MKAVKNGKYEKRGLSGGSTPSFCQDFLKSDNLLHKQGFVDFQTKTTVHAKRIQGRILIIAQFVIILGGLRSVIHINQIRGDHKFGYHQNSALSPFQTKLLKK